MQGKGFRKSTEGRAIWSLSADSEILLLAVMMINMMTPEQQWCFTRNNVRKMGHSQEVVFIVQSGV